MSKRQVLVKRDGTTESGIRRCGLRNHGGEPIGRGGGLGKQTQRFRLRGLSGLPG